MKIFRFIKMSPFLQQTHGLAYTEFALTAPLIILTTLFCIDIIFFFSAKTATQIAANEAISFGIGNRHLSSNQLETLDEAGLKNFITKKINTYSLINIPENQIDITLKSHGYSSLESANATPSEPFLSYQGSYTTGDYWLDDNSNGYWESHPSGTFGIYNDSAVVSLAAVEVTWNFTFGLSQFLSTKIITEFPVNNVIREEV